MLDRIVLENFVTIENFLIRVFAGYKRRCLFLNLSVGKNCNISHDLVIKYPQNLKIGSNVHIGPNVTIGAYESVEIMDGVTVSQDVLIETAGLARSSVRFHTGRPIKIGQNVWLGVRSIILGGVTIGDNAVIGAGAIVRTDVQTNSTYKGN